MLGRLDTSTISLSAACVIMFRIIQGLSPLDSPGHPSSFSIWFCPLRLSRLECADLLTPFFWSGTMLRFLTISIAILVVQLYDTQATEARVISRGNPGRHFNIHGINYSSMKWERDRDNRRPLFKRHRRAFFRRR